MQQLGVCPSFEQCTRTLGTFQPLFCGRIMPTVQIGTLGAVGTLELFPLENNSTRVVLRTVSKSLLLPPDNVTDQCMKLSLDSYNNTWGKQRTLLLPHCHLTADSRVPLTFKSDTLSFGTNSRFHICRVKCTKYNSLTSIDKVITNQSDKFCQCLLGILHITVPSWYHF
jgi:hypothetical protein